MSLLKDLNWRYATKKMNGKTVSQEKVDYILEASRLAPSSSGLQPYKIFVITNEELKEKIKPIAFDQSQIVDSSHLLVFAAWDGYTLEKIETVFNKTLKERSLPNDSMDAYKKQLWGMYEPLGSEWHATHAAKQAYISLGLAMAAAAEQKVDATPMEGFIPSELDKLLGLEELGLKSVLLLTLGYRDEANDWLVNMKKVRTPKEEFITEIK
ncbi:nitroreductase family protein [Urechidicola croceus]|uniref:NAD(P)H-dependent oxidoreductase n=1 Tax=Urechidicola croceus TaxID=1850246 RepID=A0A1D8P6E3_9FLAO|nr:nitroreductase family protein [Urechidicola croceus]AOW20144.1 NAD(P)H-dependent oxidoreductase [Urechidicola croceus]